MKLLLEAKPGDRVDTALVVYSFDRRGPHFLGVTWKLVLRLSAHYALAIRFVPADSDLCRTSRLARWTRLQFRLLWFPNGAPFVSRSTASRFWLQSEEDILRHLRVHGWIGKTERYALVQDLERDGWYARRKLPWQK